MRARLGAVLLAAALVLAGCNLPASDGGASPSPTPTAPPTDTPTPTETPGKPPDVGVSATGVDDPTRLAYAHSLQLVEQSFALLDRTTVRDANGSVVYRRTVRARVGEDHLTYVANRTSRSAEGAPAWVLQPYPDEPRRVETYANATTAVQRARTQDGPRVRVFGSPGAGGPPISSNRYLRQMTVVLLFGEVDSRVSEVRREEGTTVYVLTADGGSYTHGTTFFPGNREGRIRSFRALVTAEGLVREVELTYAVAHNGTTFAVTRHIAFSELGTATVDRPRWVDDALANASTATETPLAGTATPDGTEGDASTATATATPGGTAGGTPTPTPTPTPSNATAARSADARTDTAA